MEDELKKSVALDPKSVNAKLLLAAFYIEEQPLARGRAGEPGCHRYGPQEPSCQGQSCRGLSEAGEPGKG